MAGKLDLVRDRPEFFSATREPALVTLPKVRYLAIEGEGAPEGPAFQEAMTGLYGMAYTLKFAQKAEGRDFKVAPLQGQWWSAAPGGQAVDPADFLRIPREKWQFRCLIMVPDFVTQRDRAAALEQLTTKKAKAKAKEGAAQLRAAGRVELMELREGPCAQILHVGPYSEELPTVSALHRFILDNGWTFGGLHHEIYLGDPRRTKPERLRTPIRHPVKKA